jgi:hypothetical protein
MFQALKIIILQLDDEATIAVCKEYWKCFVGKMSCFVEKMTSFQEELIIFIRKTFTYG